MVPRESRSRLFLADKRNKKQQSQAAINILTRFRSKICMRAVKNNVKFPSIEIFRILLGKTQ